MSIKVCDIEMQGERGTEGEREGTEEEKVRFIILSGDFNSKQVK